MSGSALLQLLASDATLDLKPGECFRLQRSDGPICCDLRAVSVSVCRFPERVRLDPKIYEKESQLSPKEAAVFM